MKGDISPKIIIKVLEWEGTIFNIYWNNKNTTAQYKT